MLFVAHSIAEVNPDLLFIETGRDPEGSRRGDEVSLLSANSISQVLCLCVLIVSVLGFGVNDLWVDLS